MKAYICIFSISLLVLIASSFYYPQQQAVRLDRVAVMLRSGDSFQLNASQGGDNNDFIWESSNPEVAIVSDRGYVTAISKGDAIITVTTKTRKEKASCHITVDHAIQNPVLPPSWGLYIADPEPKIFNDRVYVYGSKDVANGILPSGTSWCSDEYHVLCSEDMQNWSDMGVSFHLDWIPERHKDPKYKRLWAPDVLKHPSTGKYYQFSCFNHTRNEIIMVSESSNPEGPFLNSRPLMIDGKDSIIAIDPGVLVDDDGKAYITWPFKMGQLDPDDYSKVMGNTIVDVSQWMPRDNPPFEGPSLRKRGETYYYIYIQNEGPMKNPDGSRNASPTRMAYMTSTNPLGPYTYKGLIIENSGFPNVINIHGSIVEFKNEWYLFYHMPVIDKRLTRAMYIDRISFNEEGDIIQIEPTSSGVKGFFEAGDQIAAAGAVIYGGDKTPEYVRKEDESPVLAFTHKGSYAGYKYIDMKNRRSGEVVLSVKTFASGGILDIKVDNPSGEPFARLNIPNTKGIWKQVSSEVMTPVSGKHTFYLMVSQLPPEGKIEVEWIQF